MRRYFILLYRLICCFYISSYLNMSFHYNFRLFPFAAGYPIYCHCLLRKPFRIPVGVCCSCHSLCMQRGAPTSSSEGRFLPQADSGTPRDWLCLIGRFNDIPGFHQYKSLETSPERYQKTFMKSVILDGSSVLDAIELILKHGEPGETTSFG